MSRPLISCSTIAIGASLLLCLASTSASAVTWDGETSTNWFTGTNWDVDRTPNMSEAVVINNGALARQPRLNAGNSATVTTTSISAGSLGILGSLTAINGFFVSGLGTLTIQSPGSLVGNVNSTGGTIDNFGLIDGNATASGGTFNNLGRIAGTLTNNGGTFLNSSARVSGNVVVNSGTSFSSAGVSGNVVVNGGTFRVGGMGAVSQAAGFSNAAGLLDLDGGVLVIGGSLALGQASVLRISVADYLAVAGPIQAGGAELGGALDLDFTGVVFGVDPISFDLILAGDFEFDFSEVNVSGLAPEMTFSTSIDDRGDQVIYYEVTVDPVPEPSTHALLLTGVVAVASIARRRRVDLERATS